jgi:hypothetical protein
VLTITLTNPNPVDVTGAAFTDTYPATVFNANPASGATNCGAGTVTAVAGRYLGRAQQRHDPGQRQLHGDGERNSLVPGNKSTRSRAVASPAPTAAPTTRR